MEEMPKNVKWYLIINAIIIAVPIGMLITWESVLCMGVVALFILLLWFFFRWCEKLSKYIKSDTDTELDKVLMSLTRKKLEDRIKRYCEKNGLSHEEEQKMIEKEEKNMQENKLFMAGFHKYGIVLIGSIGIGYFYHLILSMWPGFRLFKNANYDADSEATIVGIIAGAGIILFFIINFFRKVIKGMRQQ